MRMRKFQTWLWRVSLAILTLVAGVFVWSSTMALSWYMPRWDQMIRPDPTAMPSYVVIGFLLASGACIFCLTEIVRSFRDKQPIVTRGLAVLLIFASLATSIFCTFAGVRLRRDGTDPAQMEQISSDRRAERRGVSSFTGTRPLNCGRRFCRPLKGTWI